jgi:hypothetical protein
MSGERGSAPAGPHRPLFRCANERCQRPLGIDHVTMITTAHLRRFCTVECIAEGQDAHYDAIMAEVYGVTPDEMRRNRESQ